MYLRPVRVEELSQWLLTKGFAEEKAGYGHVDADSLAQELMKKYEILTYSHKSI